LCSLRSARANLTINTQLCFLHSTVFTPNDLFFVRNHNPVPVIDPEEWVSHDQYATCNSVSTTVFTPNDLFFVRNHNPVPVIDPEEWVLEIEGNEDAGTETMRFTLGRWREC
jgi:DMSO/TMAO reductase YedYZ molybdopterin-dependent catalytic subunit